MKKRLLEKTFQPWSKEETKNLKSIRMELEKRKKFNIINSKRQFLWIRHLKKTSTA